MLSGLGLRHVLGSGLGGHGGLGLGLVTVDIANWATVDLGQIVMEDDEQGPQALVKLRIHPRHDGGELLRSKVSRQGLNGLNVVVDLKPTVTRLGRRGNTKQRPRGITHNLNSGPRIGSTVAISQNFQHGNSNLSGRSNKIPNRNVLQRRRTSVLTSGKVTAKLRPDLNRVTNIGHLNEVR